MCIHHPWRDLRSRDDVTVHWAALPPGLLGASAGTDIWMEKRQLQVERRCTLTHELVHLDMEHDGCYPHLESEHVVRRVTARRLLSPHQLVPVAQWTQSVEEAADELWVTPEVLRDFMASLSPVERLMIECAVRRAHG